MCFLILSRTVQIIQVCSQDFSPFLRALALTTNCPLQDIATFIQEIEENYSKIN